MKRFYFARFLASMLTYLLLFEVLKTAGLDHGSWQTWAVYGLMTAYAILWAIR